MHPYEGSDAFFMALGRTISEILFYDDELIVRAEDLDPENPDNTVRAVVAFSLKQKPPTPPPSNIPPWLANAQSAPYPAIRSSEETSSTAWMTSVEAATYLRLRTAQGVRDAVRRGALRAYRRGRTYLFRKKDLDAYARKTTDRPEGRGESRQLKKRPISNAADPPLRPIPAPADSDDPYQLRAALADDRGEGGEGYGEGQDSGE